MTAYESTAFLLMMALLLAGISSLAASQFNTSKKFFSQAALEKSLREIYGKAELLPSGAQADARIFIPKNVSQAAVEEEDEGWALRLTLDGREYRKTSKVRLVFVPEGLLETPGMHRVLIRKESEKSAAVLEMR